ncbi:MAG TPA: hypothetical protein VNG33_20920, partial [Polyangiaceae bacterium]|nr:hypothetical protein [Polyangiaceae bacterium]
MKLGIILGAVAGFGMTTIASVASAQDAQPQPAPPPVTMGEAQPAPAAAPPPAAPVTTQVSMGTAAPAAPLAPPPTSPDGRANGLMVQARIQAQSSLASLGGGPSFVLGYQGPSYALGLGIGLTRIGASTTQDNLSASITL